MNILQVTLGYQPAVSWGGPVKVVERQSKALRNRGHEVTVYCTNLLDKSNKIFPSTTEQIIDGVRVVYFNTWSIPSWPGTLGPIWLPHLSSYLEIELENFDVVHLHGYRNLINLPVTWFARRAGIPFIIQPHGSMPIHVNTIILKRFYDHIVGWLELSGMGALIALHQTEKEQAINHGVQKDKIEVIPIGIEITANKELQRKGSFRKKFGIPDDIPLLLFLGRINKKKGTDMLVEAFAQIDKINAHLAIVGPDDGQLDEVEQLIKKYNLSDKVTLTGVLSGPELDSAYLEADLFVLPCRADTFPVTIMEACQARLPIVVTEGCEIASLVKDRVGEVVSFNSTELASAIQKLLTDKDKYLAYKTNCPKVVEDTFSLDASIDKLESLYLRLTKERINQ